MRVQMALEVVTDGRKYLQVTVKGPYVVSELQRFIVTIRETAARERIAHVLVDVSGLALPEDHIDRFVIAQYMAETWKGDIKAAFHGRSRMEFEFPEDVARNRGVNVAGFAGRAEAIAWLFSDGAA